MKKIFFAFAFVFLFGLGMAQAQSSVIKLYDDVLTLPGCQLRGESSCATVDNTLKSDVKKLVRLERFVPGSGYVAVYFANRTPHFSAQGGFTFSQLFFEPSSGGRVELGGGLQVFERGNIIAEFYQPYTETERLETQYDVVFYYLPHTEERRQQFLTMLQEDPNDFADFKLRNRSDIASLCTALRTEAKVPEVCPQGTVIEDSDDGDGSFSTDPNRLPELDFSGRPTRRPVVTMHTREMLSFVGEPITVEVDEVFDPDGKCQFYEFQWRKPDSLLVRDVSVDPYEGDLFFIPENTGAFTLTFRAREACKELGTLFSEPVRLRLIVNDKAVAFPDISQAPGFQENAIYQLYHLGVLKGYADGLMRPNELVNRAEFLKMIFETLLYRIDKEVYSPRYPDVLPSDWFAPYVWQADTLGVVKGYVDGKFRPERPVNLAEAMKMVLHFTVLDIKDSDIYAFPDVSNEDWFSRFIQTAFREGILDLEPGKPVNPGGFITRGKAAEIIVRTLLFPVNRINQTDKDVLRRPDIFEDFSSFEY